MKAKLEIYQDAAGAWRWRLQAANGRILADCGEGYTDRARAARMALDVTGGFYAFATMKEWRGYPEERYEELLRIGTLSVD